MSYPDGPSYTDVEQCRMKQASTSGDASFVQQLRCNTHGKINFWLALALFMML